jgi:multidrug efflux pump
MRAALVPPGGKEPYLTRVINRFFDALRSFYERVLRGTIGARWAVASATLLFAVAAVPMYLFSQKELAPTEDEGIVFAFVQGAPDATLESSVRGFEGIARAYMSTPETKFFFQVLMSPNTGFGGIQVRDWGERRRSTHEIQPEIFMKLLGVQSMRSVAILPPPLPGAGQFDVELVVTSTQNEALMAEHAGALIGAAYGSKKFMYAETDLKLDLPQTRLVIDRQKVADMGLDLASVGQELSVLLAGAYVNRFSLDGRSYKVIPQLEPDARTTAEQLLQLKVRTSDGGLVMVGSFAKLQPEAAPRALNRFQQRNSFKIQGLVTPGSTKEEALSALEDAARKILPPGYAIDYAGESRQIRKEGSSLAVTLGFALILIYLVLAAQFGSFRDPFIVLGGSVPLALAGALVFTFLGFTTINIYSQVGLITLVGLVAKNGILIVEFANHLQEQGLSKIDAACQSAATRLRPILMTSAATVLGHFPLVLVSGAGAEARNSIGIVLVAGMAISTIFTLFVVPALYVIVAASHAKAPVSGGVIAPRAADTPEPPIAVTRAATS